MHTNIVTQFTPANIHLHITYGAGHTLSQHSHTYVFANTSCHWETDESSQALLKPNKKCLAAHFSSIRPPHVLPKGGSEQALTGNIHPSLTKQRKAHNCPFTDGYEGEEIKLLTQCHRTNLHQDKDLNLAWPCRYPSLCIHL